MMTKVNNMPFTEAALKYAELGWKVIPLLDKRPITTWTKDPRFTEATIRTIFEAPCPFNLGIVMGSESKLMGLDIDGEVGNKLVFDALSRNDEIASVFDTFKFTTPNNGMRCLYEWTPGFTSQSIRYAGKEAVRIMTDGTQTVAPPSSIQGKPYEWIKSERLAPFPAEAIEKLLGSKKQMGEYSTDVRSWSPTNTSVLDSFKRARKYIQACEGAVEGQQGGTRTFKLCCRLVHGFRLNYHQAMILMMEEFNDRCIPPWSEKDMARKVEQALMSMTNSRNML